MLKVLMAAPFDVNGRFAGGIHSVAKGICSQTEQMAENQVEMYPFNVCRVKRDATSAGRLQLSNVVNAVKIARDLVTQIREKNAQVLYYHSSVGLPLLKDLMAMAYARKKTGIKTVVHIHFADYLPIVTGNALVEKWIWHHLHRTADAVVFLSEKTKEAFIDRGLPREKCHVIYNFSTLSYTEEELFAAPSGAETLQLLFVGSLDDRKGIFDLLQLMQKEPMPLQLHVCGGFADPEAEARFQEYCKSLGQQVQFHGFVKGEQKRRMFAQADVLVLPSYGEGLPMVILEAMAAGCGVISTTVGAIPEIVDPDSGRLIQPGDAHGLREALQYYLNLTQAQLQTQKKKNYQLSDRYSLTRFVDQLVRVCRSL